MVAKIIAVIKEIILFELEVQVFYLKHNYSRKNYLIAKVPVEKNFKSRRHFILYILPSFVRWDKISKLGPFFFQHVIKMVLSSESESRAIE